jgi:hypothetical protein
MLPKAVLWDTPEVRTIRERQAQRATRPGDRTETITLEEIEP